MVAVIERDRRLARRLAAALEARGCRTQVVHGFGRAVALLRREVPKALYVSEMLQRANGGDLLAECDRDGRYDDVPAVVRVSRDDSLFARAMRRGGMQTIVAPVDVEATANRLAGMANGEEGNLRALISQARRLKAHNRANREGAGRAVATYQKLRDRIVKPPQR
jgi:DNA-binding NtrC family response regulator